MFGNDAVRGCVRGDLFDIDAKLNERIMGTDRTCPLTASNAVQGSVRLWGLASFSAVSCGPRENSVRLKFHEFGYRRWFHGGC